MSKVEHIEGLYNFRDLGGMATDEGHIAPGILYRSEALAGVSTQGKRELEASPIGLILDLRAEREAQMLPDPQLEGIENVHIPMMAGSMPESQSDIRSREEAHKNATELLRQTYNLLISNNGKDYAEIVHRTAQAAQAGKGTLIHCSAGKDRTGTSIAFILSLVGADREQVIADYASSQNNLSGVWEKSMLAAIEHMGVIVPDSIKPMLVITPPELIRETLNAVEKQYGSVADYLLAHGGQQSDIDVLRQTLRVQ